MLPEDQDRAAIEQDNMPQEQEECDHDWEVIDDSFSHEFGTEIIVYQVCKICGIAADCEPPEDYEEDYY